MPSSKKRNADAPGAERRQAAIAAIKVTMAERIEKTT
jgi:hypothetical protein